MVTVNKTIGLLLLIIGGFLTYMFMSARKRNVIHHSINVESQSLLDKRLSVFFISDIHRRKIDDKLLAKIQSENTIDIVIIGGDLAEKGVPLARVEKNIHQLACLGPLFFIWGNNDREAGEKEIREIISRNGGKILDNENVAIPGHSKWGIGGTDDPSSGNVDINSSLESIGKYENVIFVTHTPSLFRKVEQLYQPRIMLAGHTHGGQIRFGKYGLEDKGSFRINNCRAKLISNGYGTSTIPLRLGAEPECHIIVIRYT